MHFVDQRPIKPAQNKSTSISSIIDQLPGKMICTNTNGQSFLSQFYNDKEIGIKLLKFKQILLLIKILSWHIHSWVKPTIRTWVCCWLGNCAVGWLHCRGYITLAPSTVLLFTTPCWSSITFDDGKPTIELFDNCDWFDGFDNSESFDDDSLFSLANGTELQWISVSVPLPNWAMLSVFEIVETANPPCVMPDSFTLHVERNDHMRLSEKSETSKIWNCNWPADGEEVVD